MNEENPFVGPRPFEANENELFFGREFEAKSLLSLVLSQRVVLFFAPSGAGKSSLINTRLIPGLQEEGFYVYPVGRVKGSERAKDDHPANIFTYNLLSSISKDSKDEVPTFLSFAGFLEDDTATRIDLHKPETRKALIIDQFEEIVTSHLELWQQRKDLFDQLRQGLNADPLLWLILVMREDYVANLEPYASLLPGRLQTRFYMPRMDARGALEATKGPAEKGGREFAPGVAEELVDNLRQIHTEVTGERRLGEYIEPVQLQVVCRQLWSNLSGRDSNIISAEDLKELGDIDTALAQFYDSAVQAVARNSGTPELTIRNWFEEELITETGTRSLVYEGPEQTAGLSNETVQELANRYLIRAETRPGGTWYELVHDRFLAPIHRSNRDWLLQQNPILQDAYAWDRSGRDGSYLYQGSRLEAAIEGIKEHTPDPLISEFLNAGIGQQQQQELAQRAATARRDRLLFIGAASLLIVSVALSFLLWQAQQEALRNAELAHVAQEEADNSRATIVVNSSVQAQQVVILQDLLAKQVQLLEEQKVLISGETPTSVVESTSGTASISTPTVSIAQGTPSVPTPTNAATYSGESMLQAGATQTSVAIDSQLAQVRATQTAIISSLSQEIGRSAGGLPIEVYRFGSGPKVLLLVGGLTSGFAPSSVLLANRAIDHFGSHSNNIPDGYAIHVIPNANPDSPSAPGAISGRLNANGVDLNRNFDCAWSDTASFRDQTIDPGSAPFSEPETKALRDYILNLRPAAVLFFGGRATNGLVVAGFCNGQDAGSNRLAVDYGDAANYDQRIAASTTSGDSTGWVVGRGIPSAYVLLRSYDQLSDADWAANLEGIGATFTYIEEQ